MNDVVYNIAFTSNFFENHNFEKKEKQKQFQKGDNVIFISLGTILDQTFVIYNT